MKNAISCQVSWFMTSLPDVNASKLYADTFNVGPDTTQENKSVSIANPINSLASGLVDGKAVAISIQLGRVDLSVSAPFDAAFSGSGPLFDASHLFGEGCKRLTPICRHLRHCYRLALNVTTGLPVNSYVDGMSKINALLDTNLPTQEVSDFNFQINRKRDSQVLGSMNRIIRLNVGSVNAAIGVQGHMPSEMKFGEFVFVSTDFNTVPFTFSISDEVQVPLLDELWRETEQMIASNYPLRELTK